MDFYRWYTIRQRKFYILPCAERPYNIYQPSFYYTRILHFFNQPIILQVAQGTSRPLQSEAVSTNRLYRREFSESVYLFRRRWFFLSNLFQTKFLCNLALNIWDRFYCYHKIDKGKSHLVYELCLKRIALILYSLFFQSFQNWRNYFFQFRIFNFSINCNV